MSIRLLAQRGGAGTRGASAQSAPLPLRLPAPDGSTEAEPLGPAPGFAYRRS